MFSVLASTEALLRPYCLTCHWLGSPACWIYCISAAKQYNQLSIKVGSLTSKLPQKDATVPERIEIVLSVIKVDIRERTIQHSQSCDCLGKELQGKFCSKGAWSLPHLQHFRGSRIAQSIATTRSRALWSGKGPSASTELGCFLSADGTPFGSMWYHTTNIHKIW